MKATVIRDHAALEELAEGWNALLPPGGESVFLTWQWLQAWLETAGRGVELLVVAVRDDANRLVAIAPFYRATATCLGLVSVRCLCILGDQGVGSEYSDLLVHPSRQEAALAAIADCLWEHSREWDCIWLPKLAGWTGARERWQACAGGCRVRSRERLFSAFKLAENVDVYCRGLSGNMRSNLRRQRRRVEDQFQLRLRRWQFGEDVLDVLDRFVDLHGRRWSAEGDAGAFARHPGLRSFYAALCRGMNTTGWLRMFGLELGGRLAAMQFGLVYHGVYHQLQEGFDPAAAPGIGNLLRLASIEACIEEGLRQYDFLGGFSEHKRRWGAQVRQGSDLFLHRPSLRLLPLRAGEFWPTGRFVRLRLGP